MIKNDFYPDATTYQSDFVITSNIASLNINDSTLDPMSAYYMGQIANDQNLQYVATYTYQNNIYKIEKNNSIKPSWGYTYTPAGSGQYPQSPVWNPIQNKWTSTGTSLCFINSMKYYKATMTASLYTATAILFDFSNESTLGTGEHIKYSTTKYTGSFNITTNGFYSVLFDGASWSVTINGSSYNLNMSNWVTNGCYFDVGNNKRIYISQIVNGSGVTYNCNYYNNFTFYLDILYAIDTPTRLENSRGCKIFKQVSHNYASAVVINKNTNVVTTNAAPYYDGTSDNVPVGEDSVFSIKPFEISDTVINYACSTSPTDHTNEYILNDNEDLVKNSGVDNVLVNNFLDLISWIYNAIGLAPKWATHFKADGTSMPADNNSPEYLPNTAVPIFNAYDSPTNQIIKSDTYSALDPRLRQWQKYGYNINDDEYTEENPEPVNPRPDPTHFPDRENVGESIDIPNALGVGATLGFVTQYCLNAAQISELGNLLWTSFVDPDYWKNFLFSLALDTGSFNTSAILDYFISLRVYPFPLVNIPSYAAFGTNMYIGAGYVPLEFNTALHTINTYVDWLDAGTLDIPTVFGDFRDCTNMEITLYLPFCGTVELEPADVLGGQLHVKYAVDFASGSCTAVVMLNTFNNIHYPIAILPGQIGADVPLSATSAGQISARIGSDILNIATPLASGAKGIATGAATIISGIVGGVPGMAAAGAVQAAGAIAESSATIAGQASQAIQRPGISAPALSGGRGFSAMGSPQKCYIQIRHPMYSKPDDYTNFVGAPTAKKVRVSDCTGLCRFVNPEVNTVDATEEEKNRIRALLQSGIII